MKKTLLIILGIFIFLLVPSLLCHLFSKTKSFERIDKEIAASVNAKVYYDADNVSLSVFKRFPHISATVEQFGIVGNEPFQFDTLVHMDKFQIDLNLRSDFVWRYPNFDWNPSWMEVACM
jgi:hypothetical protein